MKILELHYSTSWAGAERFVIDLCNELTVENEVVLCTIEDDSLPGKSYYKKVLKHSVKYTNLKCQSGLQLKALWRIYKTIKKEKPDIVHAHTDAICLFIPTLLYRKTHYFHTLHNLANICLRTSKLKELYLWFYKHRIKPITISQICYDSYVKLYKINNAEKINNGRSRLEKSKELISVINEIKNLKLHKDDKVFVHVARCQPEKNQQLLIDAFNRFLDEGYHGILIIIGAAYDKLENKHLLNQAHQGIYWVGLKNNVCDYLLQADFFVLSSLYEGLPISLLEALSCGVIPICTPAGGIPDVINSKKYGFVSKDFSLDNFYITLKDAFEHEPYFNREDLKEYFNANYSMPKCAREYLYVFNKEIKSNDSISSES